MRAQDFGCSREDFKCQCPQMLNATSGQPMSQQPEPTCPPAPAASTTAAGIPYAAGAGSPIHAPTAVPTQAPAALPAQGSSAPSPVTELAAAAAAPTPAPELYPSQELAAPTLAPLPGVVTPGSAPVPAAQQPELTAASAPDPLVASTAPDSMPPAPAAAPAAAPVPAPAQNAMPQPGAAGGPAANLGPYITEAPPLATASAPAAVPAQSGGALYATGMELPGKHWHVQHYAHIWAKYRKQMSPSICACSGTVGALAATNSQSAVLVAQLSSGMPPLSASAVQALLEGLVPAAVSTNVQAFPTQPNTYAIEARPPDRLPMRVPFHLLALAHAMSSVMNMSAMMQ